MEAGGAGGKATPQMWKQCANHSSHAAAPEPDSANFDLLHTAPSSTGLRCSVHTSVSSPAPVERPSDASAATRASEQQQPRLGAWMTRRRRRPAPACARRACTPLAALRPRLSGGPSARRWRPERRHRVLRARAGATGAWQRRQPAAPPPPAAEQRAVGGTFRRRAWKAEHHPSLLAMQVPGCDVDLTKLRPYFRRQVSRIRRGPTARERRKVSLPTVLLCCHPSRTRHRPRLPALPPEDLRGACTSRFGA